MLAGCYAAPLAVSTLPPNKEEWLALAIKIAHQFIERMAMVMRFELGNFGGIAPRSIATPVPPRPEGTGLLGGFR